MNIYDFPSGVLSEELITGLHDCGIVGIERIVSTGNISPQDLWYDQEKNEYVILVEGEAMLEVMNDGVCEVLLKRGDTILIPAHVKHRITYTSTEPACIWICVFFGSF